MMKRVTIAVVAAGLGVAVLAAIPAAAQDTEPSPGVTCPYHDTTAMPPADMAGWMGSAQHDDWMGSSDHSAMHDSMAARQGMMGGGNMMGGNANGIAGGSPDR